MKKFKLKIGLLMLPLAVFFFINACKKEEEPANPYASIPRGNDQVIPPVEPDPNSIVGLHKNIFSPLCANPGCHDGTFEPDYRTVESTYSTLVYQPVNKTYLDSSHIFTYRVIPNNISESWLIERLTTTTTEYMPSNGTRLSTAQIDHVKNWINAGCPDINGNLAVKPNLQPNVIGYTVSNPAFQRIDTARVDDFPLNPFIVANGVDTMFFAFIALDTADGADATDPLLYTKKEIHFSTNKNDFTGAITVPAFYYLAPFTAWIVSIRKSAWPPGTTVYFRIYVNDGHHTTDAIFPRNESLDYYKTIYAFYIQ